MSTKSSSASQSSLACPRSVEEAPSILRVKFWWVVLVSLEVIQSFDVMKLNSPIEDRRGEKEEDEAIDLDCLDLQLEEANEAARLFL